VLLAVVLLAPLALNWRSHDLSKEQSAEQFVSGILAAVEPGALVVTTGERATFGLWYARYALGLRSDMEPVGRELYQLPAYRRNVSLNAPELADAVEAETIEELIDRAADARRPVYLVQAGSQPVALPVVASGRAWELATPLEGAAAGWLYRMVD
jgi:hypothetical protein